MGEKYPTLRYDGKMGGDFEYGVWTIESNSWKEIENRIEECKNYAYIWRGQRSIEALLPTIYRGHNPDDKSIEEHLNQFKKDMPEAGTLEEFFERLKKERPREFDQDLSEYLNMILPDKNDPKEKYEKDFIDDIYWAIGQHHGLKTRLFDWTKEPYKALFFAFCKREKKGDQRVVFGLAEKSRLLLKEGQQTKRYIEFLANLGFVQKVLCSYDIPIDIKEKIGQMFNRIQAQDGLFTRTLYNQDVERYINICHNTYKERRNEEIVFLIKILMPDGVRENILEKLEEKGITYKTMYPDLQGAVLHCNLKLYP